MSNESEQNNNEALAGADQPEPAVVEFPGKRLKEVREAAHLSREEVARNLNLDVQLMAALEENDQDKLPPPAYVCGYLRSYARLLKLPEDEIVEAYNQGRELETTLVPEKVEMSVHQGSGGNLGKLVLVVVVIVVLMAVVVWRDKLPFFGAGPSPDDTAPQQGDTLQSPLTTPPAQAPTAPAEEQPPNTVDELQPVPPVGTQDAPLAPQTPPGEPRATPEDTPARPDIQALTEPRLDAPVSPVLPPPQEPQPPQQGAGALPPSADEGTSTPPADASTPLGPRPDADSEPPSAPRAQLEPEPSPVLRLEYSEPSWTEVRDSEGRVLVYRLVRAGEVVELAGEPPFTILLGYAPGVEVYYQGQPFALSPYIRDDIAYFELGQQADQEQ